MKLIGLKCPSCGAKFEVNSSLEKFTCNYCGTTTLLDKEEIIIKHLSSELETKLNEIDEYYENGNETKARELALELIKKYPSNKKLIDFLDKTKNLQPIMNYNSKLDISHFFSVIWLISFVVLAVGANWDLISDGVGSVISIIFFISLIGTFAFYPYKGIVENKKLEVKEAKVELDDELLDKEQKEKKEGSIYTFLIFTIWSAIIIVFFILIGLLYE